MQQISLLYDYCKFDVEFYWGYIMRVMNIWVLICQSLASLGTAYHNLLTNSVDIVVFQAYPALIKQVLCWPVLF